MKYNATCFIVLLLCTIWAGFACVSLSERQRANIEGIISAIPTPSPTPAPTATPTPIPPPTPVPDLSVGKSLRGVEEFSEALAIPTMDTDGRGIFLDFRGREDFPEKLALWCREAQGAAMPAATDEEPRGIFYQCR
ncbi:MAG: hypothetical protein EOM24_33715 [Chloroflexia bacterium]|nr:hypothetical protein [Chloroflexia bacterium]